MNAAPIAHQRIVDVPCTIEMEQTAESLHAHVELEGVDVGPGDMVCVHDAPELVAFGERAVFLRTATVTRANWFGRFYAHLEGYLELTELYEVGFSEGTPS